MLNIKTDKRYILAGDQASVWAQVKVTAPPMESKSERDPADIVFVIDCSGSMSGERIENAVKATEYVLQRLQGKDRACVVLYDARVEVVHPLSNNHQLAIKSLQKAGEFMGMTALAPALYEGIEQLKPESGRTQRVFLLSDGHANVGETDPQAIAEHVKKCKGIAISTFGIGDGYNEDLMEAIAQASDGDYYYIQNADDAPKAFAQELADLMAATVKDATLNIKPAKGVRILSYLGLDATNERVRIGNIPASAERTLLVECEVKAGADGTEQALLVAEVSGKGADGNAFKISGECRVAATQDEGKLADGVDEDILTQVLEFEAAEVLKRAAQEADRGNYDQAQQIVINIRQRIQANMGNLSIENQNKLRKYDQDIDYSVQSMVDASSWNGVASKSIKMRSYEIRNSRTRD
jgi:Ca-activated chloride channel family protein